VVASIAAAYDQAMRSKSRSATDVARLGPSYKWGESNPVVGQGLVGPGYPAQGTIQPSTAMMSGSMSPDKLDNYVDPYPNVPSIDRGAYGPGY
jgi:hypothetical protein